MTRTTNTRQLRETVGAVLKANGIDSLKVEADICTAVMQFFREVQYGRDPAKVREEIAQAYWNGIVDKQPFEKMRQRIMDALHINIEGDPNWEPVINFCVNQDARGETIERFAAACAENPFEMPKPFQIAQKPNIITKVWPQAFPKVKQTTREGNELYA